MSVVASAKDLKDEAGTSVVAAVSLVDPDVPEVQHYPPNTTTKQKMKDACLLDIFRPSNWDSPGAVTSSS